MLKGHWCELHQVIDDHALKAWAQSLCRQLEKAGLPPEGAEILVITLYHWTNAILSRSREGLLVSLEAALETAAAPLDVFREFVETQVAGKTQAELLATLERARAIA